MGHGRDCHPESSKFDAIQLDIGPCHGAMENFRKWLAFEPPLYSLHRFGSGTPYFTKNLGRLNF
jgi:hypothetical protein